MYDNDNIKLIHKFKHDKYQTLFANGCLYRKMIFEPYSKFKCVEYNENRRLIKIIENNPPYKIVMYEKKKNRIHTKKQIF